MPRALTSFSLKLVTELPEEHRIFWADAEVEAADSGELVGQLKAPAGIPAPMLEGEIARTIEDTADVQQQRG